MTINTPEDVFCLIHDALNTPSHPITIDSTMEDFEEWDSLGHLGILAALDTAYEGRIGTIKEMGTARSVREILTLLTAHHLL